MTNKPTFKTLDATEQLRLEESWLETYRTTSLVRPIDDYVQLAFAKNVNLDDSIDSIRQFTLLVEKGITPPATILNSLAIRFKQYLNKVPYVSLDVAFNLKRKQGVGHPLDYRLAIEERGRVIFFMWDLRHQAKMRNEKLSIMSAAGEAINMFDLSVSESVLEKNYVDMKADDIFGKAHQALLDVLKK
jgi:hypothetical protein